MDKRDTIRIAHKYVEFISIKYSVKILPNKELNYQL